MATESSLEEPDAVRDALVVRDLVAEFGLVLRGVDPGISASFADRPGMTGNGFWGQAFSIGHAEWQWLRPLLEELRRRRKYEGERMD